MKLSMTSKKWLLTLHILFGAIMFGNMITFLILSISASATENRQFVEACYQVMHLMSNTSVKASTFATTVTGICLSIWTKWGLFKYYWIIVKEVLTLLLLGMNIWGMSAWTNQALVQLVNAEIITNIAIVQLNLWIGIIIQLISLLLIFVLSVFKPWGRRQLISK
ncbi:hypothetical protein [Salinibacillus xinjiangensis]|uniref:DUF2269 family protein n=1 Tax=Salinibacillus xinjiangensis TaxID=1229268 RepID=A0A6G1X2P3_9BACI|nr:hypothetical protein [Salinibacillus xinjiangensis]MRG85098.1 hypothetical protein [Salinibacillus xinjiangensis]